MVKISYKIIFFFIIFFYHNVLYSKSLELTPFNQKNTSNYFSALVALNNNNSSDSIKFFNYSKSLKESHELYLKKYLFSLVLNEKVSTAIKEVKVVKNKNFTNFFEAQLLIALDSIKRQDYKSAALHINKMKEFKQEGNFELIISKILEDYNYLFINNKIDKDFKKEFGNLSIINRAFQSCFLGNQNTEIIFKQVVNAAEGDYSRYLFFYINYLISENNITEVEKLSKNINLFGSNLLISQTKEWVKEKNFEKFGKIFSCKNPDDIIAEFFFLIANLYSSESNFKKSNYYFNLSSYLNPKFIFNSALLAENYFQNNDFLKTKKILNNFKKEDRVYNWYRIKKVAEIFNKENHKEKSFDYIYSEFKKIENPSLKIIYDLANILKSFKKYNLAIEYYSNILPNLNPETLTYADILYRRGSSYERLGNEKKSDEDLLKSLEIDSNDPWVLNYLAYSWLERNYKIDEAINMLEKAYEQEPDNPYIIDSIGWAYYLVEDYINAEKLLRKAAEIMPDDPIVNDHYGDILWKLDRKIQASYFWKRVLTFEDTEKKMKEEIYYKLLKGPKKL